MNTLWNHFHWGEKQNSSHYYTFCKGCVAHHEAKLKEAAAADWESWLDTSDTSTELQAKQKLFSDGEFLEKDIQQTWLTCCSM